LREGRRGLRRSSLGGSEDVAGRMVGVVAAELERSANEFELREGAVAVEVEVEVCSLVVGMGRSSWGRIRLLQGHHFFLHRLAAQ